MDEYEEYNLPDKLNFKIWKRIFKELSKYPFLLIVSVLAMIVVSYGETILIKYICADGLAKYLDTGIDSSFYKFVIKMVIIMILVGSCTTIFIACTSRLERKFYKNLTSKTFSNVLKQPFAFFDNSSVGWLMARISSDSARVGEIISWGLIDIVYAIFKLLFIFIVTMQIDPKLALILLIIIPVVTIVVALFNKVIIKLSRVQRKTHSKISSRLNEGITGAKTTKTLLLENKTIGEFNDVVKDYKNVTVKISWAQTSFYQIIAFSSAIAIAFIGYFGGMSAMNASLLFLFLQYATSFFDPVLIIARLSNNLRHAQVAAERVFDLNDIVPSILDRQDVIEKYGPYLNPKTENYEKLIGDIEFKNVSFEYKKGKEVLKDFSLKVKAGSTVALVGETGAGKSTIVNLLSRFYEPTSGTILIDNKDYKDRSVHWLHSNLGYVLQSPYLFSGTIKENIKYGKMDATDEEVIKVAKLVHADEFINKMEKGYDSEVGEGGNRLSAGQKQLISFARAIINNPSLLILDEATSSVDTETEYILQKAVDSILENRTCFVVAHRLSTIVNASIILVLENGKVIESGTHDELMAKKGHYYRLFTNQFIQEKMKELGV